MVWETFLYEIRGRFTSHFHPRGGEHEISICATEEEAFREMEKLKKQGSYSDLKVVHIEIPMENGHNCGKGRETVLVKWKQKK